MKSHTTYSYILAMCLTVILCSNVEVFGDVQQLPAEQIQEDESKGFYPKSFVARRPSTPKNRPAKPRPVQPKKIVYRRISKTLSKPVGDKTEAASIGFTLWKRRPAPNDGTKGIAENKDGLNRPVSSNYERVDSKTPLAEGENIQITVESLTHKGYLYIIDREKYNDGTYSAPKIIYPIRGRDNFVVAGILKTTGVFDIVAPQQKKHQVEEVFTVIISPAPLVPADQLRGGFLSIDQTVFDDWVKRWNSEVEVIEQEGGGGQLMTDEESKGIEENRELTQDDAPPSTVYRTYIKSGDAVLVNFHVRFKSALE